MQLRSALPDSTGSTYESTSTTLHGGDTSAYQEEPRRNSTTSLIPSATTVLWLPQLFGQSLGRLGLWISSLSLNQRIDPPISKNMTASKMIELLVKHKCIDLTADLDLRRCSKSPHSYGGFGDIFSGVLVDGEEIAIKCSRIYMKDDPKAAQFLKHFAREIFTWSKYKHENVLELLGMAQYNNQIAMISPWMQYGNLLDYLEENPEADKCNLSFQAASGLAYVHESNTAHGDIKGANFLVSENGTVKLADFGNTFLDEPTLQFTRTTRRIAITVRWTAPELLEEDCAYSLEADVYALGMTILEIFTGEVPFAQNKEARVMKLVMEGKIPPRPEQIIPSSSKKGNDLWMMLADCWALDPKTRLKATDVRERMKTITPQDLVSVTRASEET